MRKKSTVTFTVIPYKLSGHFNQVIMQVILVPTDLSENSKGGIRFAINIALKIQIKLRYVYVVPLQYSVDLVDDHKHLNCDTDNQTLQLNDFIDLCYKEVNIKPGHYDTIILEGLRPDLAILDYCRGRQDIAYISISTRGASGFNKTLGTNTGNLVTKSLLPIVVVPSFYKIAPIKSLFYASDLQDWRRELANVKGLAKKFGARIEMVHITNRLDEGNAIALSMVSCQGFDLRLIKKNPVQSLISQLMNQAKQLKPDVLVIFTNRHRTLIERVFNKILAEELSFHPLVPIIVFRKIETPQFNRSSIR